MQPAPELPGNAEVRGAHTLPCPLPAPDFPQGAARKLHQWKPEWEEAVSAILVQSQGTVRQEGTGKQSQISTFLSPLLLQETGIPSPWELSFPSTRNQLHGIFLNVNHFLKVFIEFATILLLFIFLVFCLQGMWDLSAPTRDGTSTPCFGRQCLNHWTAREVLRGTV